MLFTKIYTGTYGSGKTPCFVLTANDTYMTWYCVEGSKNINATYDTVEDGVNVEELSDIDTMTASKPVNTLEELEALINEEE